MSHRGLLRHSAVSWIQQCRNEGHSFCECLTRASQLNWEGRYYSARTLEGWYYAHQAGGFTGLEARRRSDSGQIRALDPQVAQAILELRKSQPGLTVTAILDRLRAQGIIEPGGGCSRSTVYRFLHREGLDRHRLRALINEVGGPTKAWESASPNTLWMADVMDGPSLKNEGKGGAQHTWLVATLDDYSRLSPHAQFYPHQKITALLDCLRQGFERRGLPEALYTDQGKIFTGSQLKLVCANLGIRLLHARPYAAWSKGKIERFFRTLQESFFAELSFEPAADLELLNRRLWSWIENVYHRRNHAARNAANSPMLGLRPLSGIRRSFRLGDPQSGNWHEASLLHLNRLPEETRRSHRRLPMGRHHDEVPQGHRFGLRFLLFLEPS
jgi:putative transposase